MTRGSGPGARDSGLVVLKLGGELIEDAASTRSTAAAVAQLASKAPLVVIHGGGRAIDAELRARGLEPRFVDGLRITDGAALDVAVLLLAGRNNTALVAALSSAGCRAVGLTGADARIGLARRAPAFVSSGGEVVDLGLVGQPIEGSTSLLADLMRSRYLPVIASIGVTAEGELVNINADTFAAHLAGALGARRLIIAGGTAGVLDADGESISELPLDRVNALIASGAAHSGMVAKLEACSAAIARGVAEVAIVSGRNVVSFDTAPGTRIAVEATV